MLRKTLLLLNYRNEAPIIEIGIIGRRSFGHQYNHIHHASGGKNMEVEHDLGSYPSVTVVDSSGRYVIGDVQYLDENTIEVSFSASFAGKAYLN